jgi:putative tricarboxylic transport membrane protein
MRRSSLVAGIIFLVFSIIVMGTSWSMEYYSSIGPGPGFFPFWLSLILGLLSIIWIIQVLRTGKSSHESDSESSFIPRGQGLLRLLSIIGALAFMILLMDTIGFQLPMFAFLIFLLYVLGKVKPVTTLIIAAVGSFGLFRIFTLLLDVQLPFSAIPFLAGLGL